MDRLVFAAMTGARAALGQMAVTANNLANASTPGFREQVASFRAVPMGGEGANTRAFTIDTTPGSSFLQGSVESTGNAFDIAIADRGFFTVRRPDGNEVYSRGGKLTVGAQGQLLGAGGFPIVGDAGPITIPPNSRPEIADDGTVTIFDGVSPQPQVIGRLKLVNPDPKSLSRAPDGLFESQVSLVSAAPGEVRIKQGFLEGSNVSVAASMVALVSQQRLFDLNIKMVQYADTNARSANGIMSLSRG